MVRGRRRTLYASETPICGNCKNWIKTSTSKHYCYLHDNVETRRKRGNNRKAYDPACNDGYDEIKFNPSYQ